MIYNFDDKKLNLIFDTLDQIKSVDKNWKPYWLAKDIFSVLNCKEFCCYQVLEVNLMNAIFTYIKENFGCNVSNHFTYFSELDDWKLSCYGCFLLLDEINRSLPLALKTNTIIKAWSYFHFHCSIEKSHFESDGSGI